MKVYWLKPVIGITCVFCFSKTKNKTELRLDKYGWSNNVLSQTLYKFFRALEGPKFRSQEFLRKHKSQSTYEIASIYIVYRVMLGGAHFMLYEKLFKLFDMSDLVLFIKISAIYKNWFEYSMNQQTLDGPRNLLIGY